MLGGYYENACFNRNKELSSSSFIFFCTISHLHTPECYYYHQHPHIPFGEDTRLLAALRDNATSHRRDVDATRAPLFFFPPTDLCTDATAQQTAGAQPYQQAKEVPLLQTKAWQLTVMHRLDFSDNFLFAPPPTSLCNLAPYVTNQRCKLRWVQISPDTLKMCQRDLCGETVLHVQLLLSVFISEVIRSIIGFQRYGTVPSNGQKWYKEIKIVLFCLRR